MVSKRCCGVWWWHAVGTGAVRHVRFQLTPGGSAATDSVITASARGAVAVCSVDSGKAGSCAKSGDRSVHVAQRRPLDEAGRPAAWHWVDLRIGRVEDTWLL
jgi:hypothetical protein